MTIIVGAKYPWGILNQLSPPGGKIPQAVILASDGRLSEKQGDDYLPKLDVGTKVFRLGMDAVAAYAGISLARPELWAGEIISFLNLNYDIINTRPL